MIKRDGYGRPIYGPTDTAGNPSVPIVICPCGHQDTAGYCEHNPKPTVLRFPTRTNPSDFAPECA